jgi:hypothetical protein
VKNFSQHCRPSGASSKTGLPEYEAGDNNSTVTLGGCSDRQLLDQSINLSSY